MRPLGRFGVRRGMGATSGTVNADGSVNVTGCGTVYPPGSGWASYLTGDAIYNAATGRLDSCQSQALAIVEAWNNSKAKNQAAPTASDFSAAQSDVNTALVTAQAGNANPLSLSDLVPSLGGLATFFQNADGSISLTSVLLVAAVGLGAWWAVDRFSA